MTVDEFPIEIRHLMLYRQQEQRGYKDWKQFQLSRSGGFTFGNTPENWCFWNDVIIEEKFLTFYAKYPKVDYPKGMPEEIKMLALDRRVEQGWITRSLGTLGFSWDNTPERHNFWDNMWRRNYTPYYTKYGATGISSYGICTLSELSIYPYKGQIEGFPPEVVELMLQRQFEQTRKRDVSVFEDNVEAGELSGGFDWSDTPEKYNFWRDVIRTKKFDVFFEKYPKQSLINSHIKTKQNDKESTTNSTGIKVFKPVATISNGEKRTGTRISGRSSKATIGSGHISYQAVIGY